MSYLQFVTLAIVASAEDGAAQRAIYESLGGLNYRAVTWIRPLPSYREYNEFIINGLHKEFDTSHVLLIQQDGFPVNPAAWTDDFLQWDYLGAVMWTGHVGNGGFSLRSKRFCEATATLDLSVRDDKERRRFGIDEKDYHNEDLFLCIERRKDLEAMGMKFAPVELADKFSWEMSPMRPLYPGSFGFHSKASMAYLQQEGIIK